MACDGEIGDDAERCPSCGLAFGTDAPATAIAGPADPAHVGLYFGNVPSAGAEIAEEAAPVERETPPAAPRLLPPVDARRVMRRAAFVAIGVAAVFAAVVAFVSSRRPDDGYTRQEIAFERFTDADGLDPPELPATIDADAAIARIGDAETRRAATAAHRPFPDESRASIHAFFEAYLERVLEIQPDSAFRLGVHPHPRELGPFDDAADIRWLLLCRDAARVLREWPGAAALPVHDRIDRAALLDEVEIPLRWQRAPDLERLDAIDRWFDPFSHLADIACCPVDDRIAAATARLRALPARLVGIVEKLNSPPRARVLATAVNLDAADEYLGDYVQAWRGAPESAMAELAAAIGPARQAVTDCARLLRTAVALRANGSMAIGPANTAVLLRVHHHLPFDARAVYELTLDELRAAHDELRAAGERGWRDLLPGQRAPDEAQVRELRDRCSAWIVPTPADGGVTVARLPSLWAVQGAAATYLDPGAFLDPSAGVVHVEEVVLGDDSETRDYHALLRRHTLAHETYPGHRLQAVASRSACRLRRFIDDRVLVEGWAVYAENLLHETGDCAGARLDDWTRAWSRTSFAADTLIGLLVATGTVSEKEVLELLRATGWDEPTLENVGQAAATGLYALGYFPGRDEIVALRRAEEERLGSAFDLRRFHARLLAAGPISPRLIAEEWRAEDR